MIKENLAIRGLSSPLNPSQQTKIVHSQNWPAQLFAKAPVRQPVQIAVLIAAVGGYSAQRTQQHLLHLLGSKSAVWVVAALGVFPSGVRFNGECVRFCLNY
jgi:hypothetical protein